MEIIFTKEQKEKEQEEEAEMYSLLFLISCLRYYFDGNHALGQIAKANVSEENKKKLEQALYEKSLELGLLYDRGRKIFPQFQPLTIRIRKIMSYEYK